MFTQNFKKEMLFFVFFDEFQIWLNIFSISKLYRLIFFLSILLSTTSYSQAYGTWGDYYLSNLLTKPTFVNDNIGFCLSKNTKSYVLKTIDSGITWKPLAGTFEGITDLVVVNENIIWVAATGNLYKTTDGGNTWINWKSYLNINNTAVVISNEPKLYFSDETNGFLVNSNLYKTSDGGTTWVKISAIPYVNNLYFKDKNLGFAYNSSSVFERKLYRTLDAGNTWQIKDIPIELANSGGYKPFFIDENNGFLLDTNNYCLYKTTDGCSTWTKISCEYGANDLFFEDMLKGYIVNGNIKKTIDGGQTWTIVDYRYNFSGVSLSKLNTNYYITGKGFIAKMKDDVVTKLIHSPSLKLFNTNGGSFGYAKDGGYHFMGNDKRGNDSSNRYYKTYLSWSGDKITSTPTDILNAGYTDNAILGLTTNPSYTIDFTYPKPYKSENGLNWTKLFNESATSSNYSFLDISFFNDNSAYSIESNRLLKTNDSGTNWQVVLPSDDITDNLFSDLEIFSENEILIVGRKNKLYKTINGGADWNIVNIGSDESKTFTKLFFVDNSNGWAFNSAGSIFNTNDGGLTWNNLSVTFGGELHDLYFINKNEGWINLNSNTYHTIDGGINWTTDEYTAANFPSKLIFENNVNGWGFSNFGEIFKYIVLPTCPQPTYSYVQKENGKYYIRVDWNNVENTTSYNVYFGLANTINSQFKNYISTTKTSNNYYVFDYELISGKNYEIKIAPVNLDYEKSDCTLLSFTYQPPTLANIDFQKLDFAKVYPNPVKDILKIETDKNIKSTEIFSLDGKQIMRQKSKLLDMSSLSVGLYLLKVNYEDSSEIFRIIKE